MGDLQNPHGHEGTSLFESSLFVSLTPLLGQDGHEIEIGNINMTDSNDHVDRDNFDLLKVLGQGSFGKVTVPSGYVCRSLIGMV
jgi:hypothetical protein